MFRLTIDPDTAAFGENNETRAAEIARILREAARLVECGKIERVLRDINGNSVGGFRHK